MNKKVPAFWFHRPRTAIKQILATHKYELIIKLINKKRVVSRTMLMSL